VQTKRKEEKRREYGEGERGKRRRLLHANAERREEEKRREEKEREERGERERRGERRKERERERERERNAEHPGSPNPAVARRLMGDQTTTHTNKQTQTLFK
jgi:hypothetical protein